MYKLKLRTANNIQINASEFTMIHSHLGFLLAKFSLINFGGSLFLMLFVSIFPQLVVHLIHNVFCTELNLLEVFVIGKTFCACLTNHDLKILSLFNKCLPNKLLYFLKAAKLNENFNTQFFLSTVNTKSFSSSSLLAHFSKLVWKLRSISIKHHKTIKLFFLCLLYKNCEVTIAFLMFKKKIL